MKKSFLISSLSIFAFVTIGHADYHTVHDGVQTFRLGQGYNSYEDRIASPCLVVAANNVQTFNAQAGTLSTLSATSYDAMADHLGISASGRANFFAGEASASVRFARFAAESHFSRTMIFSRTVTGPRLRLDTTNLSSQNLSTVASNALGGSGFRYGNPTPATFYDVCGDTYISEKHLGASVHVAAKITATDQTLLNSFSSALNGSNALGSLRAGIERSRSSTHSSATIEIAAVQIGGDPRYLGRILQPQGSSGGPGLNVTRCDISNVERCIAVFEDIVNYATNSEENNFEHQLTHAPAINPATEAAGGVTSTGGYAVIGFSEQNWRLVLGSGIDDIFLQELLNFRSDLGRLFNDINAYIRDIDAISRATSTNQEVRDALSTIRELAVEARNEVLVTARRCYRFDPANSAQLARECQRRLGINRRFWREHVLASSDLPSTDSNIMFAGFESTQPRVRRK